MTFLLFLFGGTMATEAAFQRELIKKLQKMFPDCFIIVNDPQQTQGLPDLLILFNMGWAMLEVKRSENAPSRPNQPHYIEMFGQMSWAAFIYPENEEEILRDLQFAFGS